MDLKSWLDTNKYKIGAIAATIFLMNFLARLPYFGLLIDSYVIYTVTALSVIFILDIDYSKFIFIGLALLILGAILVVLGRPDEAEFITNLIYPILIGAVIKAIGQNSSNTS